jgi:hypothetical protein
LLIGWPEPLLRAEKDTSSSNVHRLPTRPASGRTENDPELIIQLLKLAIGLAFGAYFVWWSLEVLNRLTPEDQVRAAVIDAGPRPTREAAMAAFAASSSQRLP